MTPDEFTIHDCKIKYHSDFTHIYMENRTKDNSPDFIRDHITGVVYKRIGYIPPINSDDNEESNEGNNGGSKEELCPICNSEIIKESGCSFCSSCGWSACSIG